MYCTIEDLINRVTEKTLVNLTNDVIPANTIKREIAEDNITIADDLINSSLRNKYVVPLKSVPNLVKQLSADITIYRLYCRRPQNVPENYKKNYEVALQILKDLQSGAKVLDIPSSSFDGGNTAQSVQSALYLTDKADEDRIFTDDFLRGMTL